MTVLISAGGFGGRLKNSLDESNIFKSEAYESISLPKGLLSTRDAQKPFEFMDEGIGAEYTLIGQMVLNLVQTGTPIERIIIFRPNDPVCKILYEKFVLELNKLIGKPGLIMELVSKPLTIPNDDILERYKLLVATELELLNEVSPNDKRLLMLNSDILLGFSGFRNFQTKNDPSTFFPKEGNLTEVRALTPGGIISIGRNGDFIYGGSYSVSGFYIPDHTKMRDATPDPFKGELCLMGYNINVIADLKGATKLETPVILEMLQDIHSRYTDVNPYPVA